MLETQDLKDFSITTWYEQFKNVAVKTYLFEITPALLQKFRSEDFDFDIEEICTPEYVNQIKNAISTFGNEAFVKNNWHAPTDAKFISFGNLLKVTNINDILMYLTASDIIINDLANDKFIPFYIALKPWINIHPATEFRCIVINDILRDVFDVIITFPDSVSLVDFGPLNNRTNLYAFSWKEIQPIIQKNCSKEVAPVFRYLENDIGIMTRQDTVFKVVGSQT